MHRLSKCYRFHIFNFMLMKTDNLILTYVFVYEYKNDLIWSKNGIKDAIFSINMSKIKK